MDISQVYITIPLYNDSKMILKVIKFLNDNGYNVVIKNEEFPAKIFCISSAFTYIS